jgi:hypothetical protein
VMCGIRTRTSSSTSSRTPCSCRRWATADVWSDEIGDTSWQQMHSIARQWRRGNAQTEARLRACFEE